MDRSEAAAASGNAPGNAPANAAAAGAPPAGVQNRITELRVSGHLMTLEAGLFCVFQTAGGTPADAETGLPGVRISIPPGPAGRPEAVSVSTFRADGWLDGTGALIRVADGTAQVLVTVYQSPRQAPEAAPRLQVLRLSGDPAATAAAAPEQAPVAVAPPAPKPEPEVVAHVQRTGDVGVRFGEWIGTKGSGQWIEGFGLIPRDGLAPEDVEYQAVLGRGWLSPWVEGGKFCGSRGMALPLLGIKVRLKGAAAKDWECSYAATFTDGSSVGPVSADEVCEAESLAALESFRVDLQRRAPRAGGERPAERAPAPAAKPARPTRPGGRVTRSSGKG
jgi:hypothetical protein